MCILKECLMIHLPIFKACLHMCVQLLQSCSTLCDPMDWSSPGSSVHGILQARILVWVAMSSPGDRPSPGIKPESFCRQILYLWAKPVCLLPISFPSLFSPNLSWFLEGLSFSSNSFSLSSSNKYPFWAETPLSSVWSFLFFFFFLAQGPSSIFLIWNWRSQHTSLLPT